MSKDNNNNRWWPPQKMPIEYWITDKGLLDVCVSQGRYKTMKKEEVMKLAEDAEILAKELREAAALMKG